MPRKSKSEIETEFTLSYKKSRMLLALSEMPPKDHWPERSSEFDYQKSEVCQWLMARPELWEWAFEKARSLGAIKYDSQTGKWAGSMVKL